MLTEPLTGRSAERLAPWHQADRLLGLGTSPIRRLSEGAPVDASPLGLGEPGWPMPLVAREALAQVSDGGYGPNDGLATLRQAIARRYGCGTDQVRITAGSQGALFSLMQAWLQAEDAVLIPDPGFPAYGALARLAGARFVRYSLAPDGALDADALLAQLETTPEAKVAVINHPSNPTGGGASARALADVARRCEELGVLLISDEVYSELYLGEPPLGLREVSDHGVVISSVSKGWGAPGLRVGWAIGDPKWLAPASTVHAHATTAASSITQRAALALLEASNEVLCESRQQVTDRWQVFAAAAREHLNLVVERPAGGFYAWLPIPEASMNGGFDDMRFCLRLRDDARVVVVPGTVFGPAGRGFLRLSFAAAPESIAQGVERMAPYWRTS